MGALARGLAPTSYTTTGDTTPALTGLHENDFIMASKINQILGRSDQPVDRQQ